LQNYQESIFRTGDSIGRSTGKLVWFWQQQDGKSRFFAISSIDVDIVSQLNVYFISLCNVLSGQSNRKPGS